MVRVTIDLRAIRLAAGLTQVQQAAKMGFSPRSGRVTVAEIEGRQDWLLSSLTNYLRACGAAGELVVQVAGEEFRFDIA